MARKVKFKAGGQKANLAEATALVLLHPRAPTLPTLSLEQVLALDLAGRCALKAKQAKFWGREWAEMAADRNLLGGMALSKRR